MKTETLTDAQTADLAELQAIIEDPARFAALLTNDALQESILNSPHLAETFEAAILAHDKAEAEAPVSSGLAASLAVLQPASKPAKSKPVSFTYRTKTYRSGTAGNVIRGKERKAAAHTIAVEQIDSDGQIHNRLMLGCHQADMIARLPKADLAKLRRK